MTVDPAGSAAAALNTQAVAIQRPPEPPARLPVNTPPEPVSTSETQNNVAQTSRVNENSRLGSVIDTFA